MPQILGLAARQFARVMLISNFYAPADRLLPVMKSALSHEVHIVCSFDGYGSVADTLRGAADVSKRVTENMQLVTELRKQTKSRSVLEVHSVLTDANLDHLTDILEMSQRLDWKQTVAPVNAPAQSPKGVVAPGLTASPRLDETIQQILEAPNLKQLHSFVSGIPAYAEGTHKVHCPYLSSLFRDVKVFLEPNGDVSLCDRTPIGNLNTTSMNDILRGTDHRAFLERARKCGGCWLSCFTEPALAANPKNALDVLRHRVLN